tara:strand:+ start:1151 stop:2587 length:1437 start_codon:yes stop_codon:yes gene_type:complete
MIRKFLVAALAITTITASAQNELDALRYSTQNPIGTARFAAMGGAFGSLGGEFSGLSSNPAGIGMYQFSELTFTPNFNLNTSKSYYNNSQSSSYQSDVSIGNLGLILTIPKNNTNWKRINIGIGWNQLADYNNSMQINGTSKNNSIVDRILEITNGTLTGELINGTGNTYSQMAWNTYLIDPLFNNNNLVDGEYISNFSAGSKIQSKFITSSGNMNEFVFSIGGTYKERLYVGGAIGMPTINYYEYSEYTEHELSSDTSNNLRQMSFSEEISAYGTGYNLKIGAIYRLSEKTKIGGALHTPTFFNIKEDYNTSITTFFKDSTLEYSMGYLTPFHYDLITPLKASISASTVFNNIIISAEYELVDYSTAKYFTTNFDQENQVISDIYQQTENIKIGTELNLKPFILRAGYSNYGSPTKEENTHKESFCYGIGINNGNYFIDLAYVLSQGSNRHLLYAETNTIELVNTNHTIVFTLGLRY